MIEPKGEDGFPRKLAAILYADVAGYSRHTGRDEDGTHRQLRRCLGIFEQSIGRHRGRVVHYAGDAVLAEFGTASDALACAVDAQREMSRRGDELDEEERLRFRVGVNLGEVIVDDPEIYGDGVNVAARLESLAEPGGICISESVFTTVGNRLPLRYEPGGDHLVKNIERPVRVYRVVLDGASEGPSSSAGPPRESDRATARAVAEPRSRRRWLAVPAIGAVAAGAAIAFATSWPKPTANTPPLPLSSSALTSAREAPASPVATRWQVPVGSSPVKGSTDALVTIVEFADFQCPLSKSTAPVLDRLVAELPADVRVVWKEDPLAIHPRAEAAALLAREAFAERGALGFWAAHDRLFALQSDLDDQQLEELAKALELEATAAHALSEPKYTSAIDADIGLADGLEVVTTPTLFVNGRRLEGAQRYEALRAVVDEELAKARDLVAGGVARVDVYTEILRKARPPREPEQREVDPPVAMPPFQGGGAEEQIVVQVFCDYEEPMCRRFAPTIGPLLELYGDRLLVWWRDAPSADHPHARLAASAAREAFAQRGSSGFVQMRDRIFEGQTLSGGLEPSALEGYAKSVRLDLAAFRKALDGGAHDAAIDADARAAEKAGVKRRPALLVGPYFVEGATSLRTITKLCDRVLAAGGRPVMAPP